MEPIHTLESLRKLAESDDGKHEISRIVARFCGADKPVTKWKFACRSALDPLSRWLEYPCCSSKDMAERKRLEFAPDETTEPESYEVPPIILDYAFSLDDMAEAEKTLTDAESCEMRDWLWLSIPSPAKVRRFHNPLASELAIAFILTKANAPQKPG